MHIHVPTTLADAPVLVPSLADGAKELDETVSPILNVTVVDKLHNIANSSRSAFDSTSVNEVYATPE